MIYPTIQKFVVIQISLFLKGVSYAHQGYIYQNYSNMVKYCVIVKQ